MDNSTYRIKNCNCLQGCSEVKYKFFVASSRKFTDDEVEQMCQYQKPHWLYVFREQEAVAEYKQMKNLSVHRHKLAEETCKQYLQNEYAHVRVRIDGSSFMKHSAGLSYSTSDKFALVGGTVGLFSGFSVLVIFEIIHWLVTTIRRAFYPDAASVKPEVVPVEKKFEEMDKEFKDLDKEVKEMDKEMKKENDALKAEIAKLKEILMKKENVPTPEKPSETVVDIE